MCKATDKLKWFSYILYELNLLYQNNINLADDKVEVSTELTNKKIMKLLYFLCLESVVIDARDNLFSTFDNFVAYPKGPVEKDVYRYIDIIPNVIYQDSYMKYITTRKFDTLDIERRNLINISFNNLSNRLSSETIKDVNKLVEISHCSPSWINAYNFSIDKLMDLSNLQEEYEKYEESVAKIQQ